MAERSTKMRTDETLKFRIVTHVTSARSLDVGDVDGNVASLNRFSGLAFLPVGTVGTVQFASSVESSKTPRDAV